ncbi:MAG: hypothetical protein HC771_25690 [Synechococcales cyanobacterium CRU_2_2]|nr:hypothetical protein [Synechococcales cyanobacterium CRU_2_2]
MTGQATLRTGLSKVGLPGADLGLQKEDITIAEALKPDYATAHNNLGFAYERKQLTVQALQSYEQALAIEPSNSTAKKRAESMRKRIMPTAV